MEFPSLSLRPAAPFVLFFCAGAVCMDLRDEKIDNGWILIGLLLAAAERMREYFCLDIKEPDVLQSLGSMVLPFVILFPFFCFRMIGAGDIKAMMVLGMFMDPKEMLRFLLCTFLLAAGCSICKLFRYRNGRQRVRYFLQYLERYLRSRRKTAYCKAAKRPENLHMAVPILLAAGLWSLSI